jgi:hypothetical protein
MIAKNLSMTHTHTHHTHTHTHTHTTHPRRPGLKRVALPGLPWSPEFMAAYENAMAGQPLGISASRIKPGQLPRTT